MSLKKSICRARLFCRQFLNELIDGESISFCYKLFHLFITLWEKNCRHIDDEMLFFYICMAVRSAWIPQTTAENHRFPQISAELPQLLFEGCRSVLQSVVRSLENTTCTCTCSTQSNTEYSCIRHHLWSKTSATKYIYVQNKAFLMFCRHFGFFAQCMH